MFRENSMVRNAAVELQKVFTADQPEAGAVQTAFENFGSAIAASVQADFESAHGDQAILIQRGFRVLTSEERGYYQTVIDAGKQKTVQTMNGLMSEKIMPITIIEDVYKNLTQEHPLLAKINFQSVEYMTRWIMNDHSVQTAVWGDINDAITKEISSAFKTVEITQCKLSAFAVIELDMLDLGPTFLDGYIRTFIQESIYAALEKSIVSGTGKNEPIGLDRDIHHGVSVSSTEGYPRKTAKKVTSFMPKEYGALLAELAVTEAYEEGGKSHGGNMRAFNEVTLICNQVDYLTKIMPATTVLNSSGVFVNNLFPFPTEVIRSNALNTGEAILCLPEDYFFGIGTSKNGTLTYSDDFKFLEDKRVFKIKMHGMGKAYDNTVSILLDISTLEEAYIYLKAAGAAGTAAKA